MSDPTIPEGVSVHVDGVDYPVRWADVSANQVGLFRMVYGWPPQRLIALLDAHTEDAPTIDLPEMLALVHLSRLQAGDKDFDAEVFGDSLTLGSTVRIDALAAVVPSDAPDADPEA